MQRSCAIITTRQEAWKAQTGASLVKMAEMLRGELADQLVDVESQIKVKNDDKAKLMCEKRELVAEMAKVIKVHAEIASVSTALDKSRCELTRAERKVELITAANEIYSNYGGLYKIALRHRALAALAQVEAVEAVAQALRDEGELAAKLAQAEKYTQQQQEPPQEQQRQHDEEQVQYEEQQQEEHEEEQQDQTTVEVGVDFVDNMNGLSLATAA